MNSQRPEKAVKNLRGLIDVAEIFETIQGEGPFVGEPATFIRLSGCNLSCRDCDTDYTTGRRFQSVSSILEHLVSSPRLIVITGGEPFRQYSLGNLVNALLGYNYKVQIETNGTLYVPGPWESVTVVCSPKTPKLNETLLPSIKAYKYVLDYVYVAEDGLPTRVMGNEGLVARPPKNFTGPIYLQPLDVKSPEYNQKNLEACIRSCKKFGYTLSVQLHKIIGLP